MKVASQSPALEKIFDQVARLNLYDPTQNYLIQAQESLAYRLKEDPKNKQYAYAYAFTQVLRRNVGGAIAAFNTVTQLDLHPAHRNQSRRMHRNKPQHGPD